MGKSSIFFENFFIFFVEFVLSFLLRITMFFSPFISLIPGFIIKGVKACTGSQHKGDFWSLIIIFVVCCAGCTIVSLQMCYQATSQGDSANTWFFLNTFCAWRTLVYANPAQVSFVIPTLKIKKSRKGVVWWRTRDSLSHVSQCSDS